MKLLVGLKEIFVCEAHMLYLRRQGYRKDIYFINGLISYSKHNVSLLPKNVTYGDYLIPWKNYCYSRCNSNQFLYAILLLIFTKYDIF